MAGNNKHSEITNKDEIHVPKGFTEATNYTAPIKTAAGELLWQDLDQLGKKNNFVATLDPTQANDQSEGYSVGSRWINTATANAFICVKASAPAEWHTITKNVKANVNPTLTDDRTKGFRIGSIWVSQQNPVHVPWICTDDSVGSAQWVPATDEDDDTVGIPHPSLSELDSDDHLQYLNRNGSRAMSANLDMDGHKIVNLAAGVDPTDAVNRQQYNTLFSDERFKSANQIRVKKNPGFGEFDSVFDALDSISDASDANPYVVLVSPGIYIEPTLMMKEWVAICGDDPQSSILRAQDPDAPFIIGNINSALRDLTIDGATGPNGIGILHMGGAGITPFFIERCQFANNKILVKTEAAPSCPLAMTLINDCQAGGSYDFSIGFQCRNTFATVGEKSYMIINSVQFQDVVAPQPVVLIDVEGEGTLVAASNMLASSYGTGDAVRVADGASFEAYSCLFEGFDHGIHAPNVGVGSTLRVVGTSIIGTNVCDVHIEHPSVTGSIQGVMQQSKIVVDPAADIKIVYSDPTPGGPGKVVLGDLLQGDRHDRPINLSKLVRISSPMGLTDGGVLTAGAGLTLNVSAGGGFLDDPAESYVKEINWPNSSILLPNNATSYVFFNASGTLTAAPSFPSYSGCILLGRVHTGGGFITSIEETSITAHHAANHAIEFNRDAIGGVVASGLIASESGTRGLNITGGRYYFGTTKFSPSGGNGISFTTFRRNGSGSFVVSMGVTQVPNNLYDNNTIAGGTVPSGKYVKHALYVVGQGVNEHYMLVHGQELFDSLVEAEDGGLPIPPANFDEATIRIWAVVVSPDETNFVALYDERPAIAGKVSVLSAAATHSNLLGLDQDDHTQYLLVSGSRAMSGTLNMGGNAITNVGLVDGVDVSAHAARHLPNGVDPLTTAAPVTIGTANTAGTANSFSRSDHTHNHGTQSDPGHHALATTSSHGFMSSADKTVIDNLTSGVTPQSVGTSNVIGTSVSFARADHVHDHGNQTSPSHHALVTQSSHGFMSSADKAKLDSTGQANGIATLDASTKLVFSQVPVGTPVAQLADQANAAGTAVTVARADHVHNIATGVPVNTGTANAQGVSTNFAKADHVHNTVIQSFEASSTTLATQATTATDTLIASMQITNVPAGTYRASFASGLKVSNNGREIQFVIYVNGVAVEESRRTVFMNAANDIHAAHTAKNITVGAGQTVEVRWNTTATTANAFNRSLSLIRLS